MFVDFASSLIYTRSVDDLCPEKTCHSQETTRDEKRLCRAGQDPLLRFKYHALEHADTLLLAAQVRDRWRPRLGVSSNFSPMESVKFQKFPANFELLRPHPWPLFECTGLRLSHQPSQSCRRWNRGRCFCDSFPYCWVGNFLFSSFFTPFIFNLFKFLGTNLYTNVTA